MLSHCFVVHIILLTFECDGYGGGCVEQFSIPYFPIALAEYDVVAGDNLGFSCAGCL